ncbi:MAG: cyclase family protein [bacterium]
MFNHIIDLTHDIRPGMPLWPGDPAVRIRVVASIARDGYLLRAMESGEHTGTHIGAPAHFEPGGITVEQIPPETLVRPAIVIDVVEKAEANPDYALVRGDITLWEDMHGRIPHGCVVLLRTGWRQRWNDPTAFLNIGMDALPHFPGFSAEAAGILIDQRGCAALGTDTHGIDPGNDPQFRAGRLLAARGRYHIECLNRLDALPPAGALLIAAPLTVDGGSGSPARIFAFLPD